MNKDEIYYINITFVNSYLLICVSKIREIEEKSHPLLANSLRLGASKSFLQFFCISYLIFSNADSLNKC
jgi:hypothetical protein